MYAVVFILTMLFTFFAQAASLSIVTEELPPLQIRHNSAPPTGAMVDVVNLLLNKLSIKTTIEIYPWARSYQIALDHDNTLIFSMLRDEDREDKFQWIGKLYTIKSYLVSLKSRTDIKVDNIEAAKQYSVGSIRKDLAENYLRKHGFDENKNLYLSSDFSTLWQMLFNGRTDLAFTNSTLWKYELEAGNLDPEQIKFIYTVPNFADDLYLAASLGTDKALVERLTSALAQIKTTGEYQAILTKWQL